MAPPCSITIQSDIITEILYRLPAKSVGRFRCVSKGWLSQLTEPHFIKTHQNTLNRNHLIISSSNNHSLYSLPVNQNHEEEATLSTPAKFRYDLCRDNIYVQGCCNGLVLLSHFERDLLVVLNPTTGEFLKLPGREGAHKHNESTFGFGYDSVTDDYKVVVFPHVDDVLADAYSLKDNTWKSSMSCYPMDLFCGCGLSGVFVNGCLHWLDTNTSSELEVIVAFSLKNDNFSQMALPNNMGNDVDILNNCKLANLSGKFAVYMEFEGTVWLMNEYGVKESWTKIILYGFSGCPADVTVVDFHGKILVVRWHQMCIYNLEDGSLYKHIDIHRNLRDLSVRGICAESLVPLPKLGSVGWISRLKRRMTSSYNGLPWNQESSNLISTDK